MLRLLRYTPKVVFVRYYRWVLEANCRHQWHRHLFYKTLHAQLVSVSEPRVSEIGNQSLSIASWSSLCFDIAQQPRTDPCSCNRWFAHRQRCCNYCVLRCFYTSARDKICCFTVTSLGHLFMQGDAEGPNLLLKNVILFEKHENMSGLLLNCPALFPLLYSRGSEYLKI